MEERKVMYGAAAFAGDHVLGAGLRDEERAYYIHVDEFTEERGVVGFGFDIGAGDWYMSISMPKFDGEGTLLDDAGRVDNNVY